MAFALGTEQHLQEQKEQRIVRAYKRQRAEEQERAARARADESGTTAGARHRFYDSVFRGDGASTDDVLDELYGAPQPPRRLQEPRAEEKEEPQSAPREEEEEEEQAAARGARRTGGIVNSKATRAWKAEERRRIAEQEAARARQAVREKKARERRAEHKLLAQRTRRGQPVMANVVTHLLKKLEKQAAVQP